MAERDVSPGEDPQIPRAIARKPGMRWLQPVWIIPIVAVIIGGWLTFQHFIERGPTIQVRFRTAEGLEAGKTRIKYKDVDIGIVRRIELGDDRNGVVVTAEMVKQASSGLLVEDSRFWVVRPRISGGRVSGLGTLLAGASIALDPGKSTQERREFEGLETPPVVTEGLPGRAFRLTADDVGSLDLGSPVYFRGITAGQVVSTEATRDGSQVIVGIFIDAPFDQFVTPNSRFWNASGVDLSLDASGLKVNTESMISVLVGGIAFDTPPGAQRASPNDLFVLWADRATAMRARDTVIEDYAMYFDRSVRGLAVGAPVDFRGITIGEVSRIDLEYEPDPVNFRTRVDIHLFPERLKPRARDGTVKPSNLDKMSPEERMRRFVSAGFRGQLRDSNVLTGSLYIALDFIPNAPPAAIDFHQNPPVIPTAPGGGLTDLQESVARILKHLEKVPFDQIGEDLRKSLAQLQTTLETANKLEKHLDADIVPEMKRTLEQARRTLEEAQKAVSDDAPLQTDLRDTLDEVNRASRSLRALVDYLERHPDALIRGRREEGY
jgi:paraquat-inducible protein B